MNQFQSFEEFWPHFLNAHRNANNRKLHFAGLTIAIGMGAWGLRKKRFGIVLSGALIALLAARSGHQLFEAQMPSIFGHPLWSIRGDMRMCWLMLLGKIDKEVNAIDRQL